MNEFETIQEIIKGASASMDNQEFLKFLGELKEEIEQQTEKAELDSELDFSEE